MQRTMLFKKFLMPCGLCAAVPVMKPNPEDPPKPCHNEEKKLIRPSELPIYPTEDGYSKQMPCVQYPSIVEDNIRKVRQTVGEVKLTLDRVSSEVSSTFENFKYVIDYLQDEANMLPRVGAVGIGGLSGLVLGLRGGMIKRLFYTATGAGIVGCVCFPKEAKEAVSAVERYGNISYNFIYGVKPGDAKKETSLDEFPMLKSITESEYFRMLIRPFEKTSSTTDKAEENPSAKKSEKEKE
ncbi:MICOS complex subunit 26/27 [Xylocopa sonorina]|uniref:MICOS complex subunit 26/27 n=1 Tax=Xylocopa sonorina TaxID=1818115 RepID=UPI00403B286E